MEGEDGGVGGGAAEGGGSRSADRNDDRGKRREGAGNEAKEGREGLKTMAEIAQYKMNEALRLKVGALRVSRVLVYHSHRYLCD
jgi:hypothetical protein